MKNNDTTILEFRILNELKKGTRIKRHELKAFGVTDRSAREAIQNLQLAGYPVINLQDGCGYRLAESEAELREYRLQELGRAKIIEVKCEAMKFGKVAE